MTGRDRYKKSLSDMPAPGSGCHVHILRTANTGTNAGVDPETLFQDIRSSIPPGNRKVADREIVEAIQKARVDAATFTPKTKPRAVVNDGTAAFQRIVGQARSTDEDSLIASSPIPISTDRDMFKTFFENLYNPGDLLFIGDRLEPGIRGRNIRTALDWLNTLWNGEQVGPYIIPNPLTGQQAQKRSGGWTLRGDGNVKTFRYCVVEFDDISKEKQIAFWNAVNLPVACLIDSGGKSIHAWINVQKLAPVASLDEWARLIKGKLYDQMLTPLGVDAACSNPARLSRAPGYFREEKGNYQKLLWLRGIHGND